MLPIILSVIAALVVVVLALAATKSKTFRVQREAAINAAPAKLFALINDFHRWPEWSPWEKLDPAMTRCFSESPAGRGAVYDWNGNKKVGAGRMEILESAPPSRVKIQLDFIRPFEAHNTIEISMSEQKGVTRVLWVMDGPSPFMMRVMRVFMNMDAMVGKDFERGLANLKSAVGA